MQLHHINIKAPYALLERERDFFRDLLGLREGPRPAFSGRGFWLYDGDDAIVHLSESDRHTGGGGQGCFDHVAFQTSGLARFADRLRSLEIGYRDAYLEELDLTQLFLESPTGTRIEINFVGEKLRVEN